jgi:hypothetical protein
MNLNTAQYDAVQKANASLEKALSSNDYSQANVKQGYLDGLIDCKRAKKKDFLRLIQFAEWNLGRAVDLEQWGKAAYWKAYISGFEVMKTIIEVHKS